MKHHTQSLTRIEVEAADEWSCAIAQGRLVWQIQDANRTILIAQPLHPNLLPTLNRLRRQLVAALSRHIALDEVVQQDDPLLLLSQEHTP